MAYKQSVGTNSSAESSSYQGPASDVVRGEARMTSPDTFVADDAAAAGRDFGEPRHPCPFDHAEPLIPGRDLPGGDKHCVGYRHGAPGSSSGGGVID
jgi:hypothetical protein